MKTEERRRFIINVVYFGMILAGAALLIKYVLPMLTPFVAAFVIAYLLDRPIRFLSKRFHVKRRVMAILLVLIFYATVGMLITLGSVKLLTRIGAMMAGFPTFYSRQIEPMVTAIFANIEQAILQMDPAMSKALVEVESHMIQSLGQLVSSVSMGVVSFVSGTASSVPGTFVNLVLLIIATFFISLDYDKLTGFCLRQMNETTKEVFMEVQSYIVGTLFVCILSYALIMSITFVELSIGLTLIRVEHSVLIALGISIFDILPVLGTGGIMIPWVVISAFMGDSSLAIGLLVVYIVITVIRNIIEPKIVGGQIGLHPVVTLSSMFLGVQLFGVLGLFGFPIGLSLLRDLNEKGTIKLFK